MRCWVQFGLLSCVLALLPAALMAQDIVVRSRIIDPPGNALPNASVPQTNQRGVLSGTVVDPTGAVIAGATVLFRSADGTVQRTTRSDSNGSFTISGLPAGNYRLVVSNPGFESKEVPVTIPATGALTPLRISLAVSTVSTTINVQGRENDLVGVADSATQGTVGAEEIQDRPILRSGEILEAVPGLIITQHAGGGKAYNIFFAASILTTARISPFSSTICR